MYKNYVSNYNFPLYFLERSCATDGRLQPPLRRRQLAGPDVQRTPEPENETLRPFPRPSVPSNRSKEQKNAFAKTFNLLNC